MQREQDTGQTPSPLLALPDLSRYEHKVSAAFSRLRDDNGNFSFSELAAYCQIYDLPPQRTAELLSAMRIAFSEAKQ